MNKTVCLFIGDLTIGGAQRVVVNLAKGFSQEGYNVEIVLLKKNGELLAQVPKSVNVIELSTDKIRWCAIPLVRYLKSSNPDTLISFLTGANIMAIIGNRLAGRPSQTIITEHSIKSERNRKSTKRDMFLAKYTYKYADDIVGVSNGVIRDIHSWTGIPISDLSVVYNPVVEDGMDKKNYIPPTHPWFTDPHIPIILSVGRHSSEKDYSTLIQAFSEVTSKIDARLVLLGGGELTAEYRQLAQNLGIENDLFMPGWVSNPYPYMAYSDVFALSSRVEGLSNVLIEAMNFGTPVVSTDCPTGPSEILKNGQLGPLVPVGDETALADAILNVLDDPISPDILQVRASKFSINTAVNQYKEIMKNK